MPPMRRKEERINRMLKTSWKGSLGGDVLNASPIYAAGGEDLSGFDSEDAGSDGGSDILWALDQPVATAGRTAFATSFIPVENSLAFTINGDDQTQDVNYTIDWTTGDITYLAADIAVGDSIEMRYMTKGDATSAVQESGVIIGDPIQESPGVDVNFNLTATTTFDDPVEDGNVLVVLWMGNFDRTVVSMVGCGATWTRAVRVPGDGFSLSIEIWIGTGASGGGTTITATRNATGSRTHMKALEMPPEVVGTVRTTSSAGPATNAAPQIPAITPQVGEVVIGMTTKSDNTIVFTGSPTDSPDDWTSLVDLQGGPGGVNWQTRWGYRTATDTDSHSRQYALTGSAVWVGATIVLR